MQREDNLPGRISRRRPDHTVELSVGQDHPFVDSQEVSELIGPPPPQWLVDLFGACNLPWRQACPSCVLLTLLWPETLPVVDNLLVEVLAVISPGTAHWILFEAIDERLWNGRSICRHVRCKVGIRYVKEQEIHKVDIGGYRWCVNFIGDLVTRGRLRDDKHLWRARRSGRGLRSERTPRPENRDT